MLYYRYGRYGWRGELGERWRWIRQVPSFPLPYLAGARKVGIYVCLSAPPFFVKLEQNVIFLRHYVFVKSIVGRDEKYR